ncbi:MAG: ABC transporter ATP-binding protein/permease [Pseudomonadota bacterium]
MTEPRQGAADLNLPFRGEPYFFRRFCRLAGPYWRSANPVRAFVLTAALVALTVAQVLVPIAINQWSLRLFDAIEQRALGALANLVFALAAIIVANVLVTTTHLRVKRRLQVDWRNWLTGNVLDEWLTAGRHYHVRFMPGEHDNPDQRIAEDIRIATEYAVDLVHSLFYCLLLLASFTWILWGLSGSPHLEIGGANLYLPGHLVWIALLYAATGTVVALLLGRPLVRAANRRQTDEANFRFGLARTRENALAIALRHGEPEERRHAGGLFGGVIHAWDRQTRALAQLFYFSSSWSVLSQAFPVLVAAPRYFAGTITLGVLMQTAQAFQQMIAALSWPIDNIPRLAEWRASAERVLGLTAALQQLRAAPDADSRPAVVTARSKGPSLGFHDVTLSTADGEIVLNDFSAEIARGERVLMCGDRRAAVTLFRAVGGLSPWGSGRIELPADGPIFFMPRRPYMPAGPLRDVLSVETAAEPPGESALHDALVRVGLEHLIPRLDERGEWEQALTAAEKQRLGFARLLLAKPSWIFVNEATDALGPKGEAELLRLVAKALPRATVVAVGCDDPPVVDPAGSIFYTRRLHLSLNDDASAPAAAPAPAAA